MGALLDEMPVAWSQVGDLALGAAREWASPRAFGWPARRSAGRILVVRGVKFFACAWALDGVARVLAAMVTSSGMALPSVVEGVVIGLYVAFSVRFLVGVIYSFRGRYWHVVYSSQPKTIAWPRWPGSMHGSEIALWYFVMLAWLVNAHVQSPPTYGVDETARALMPYLQLFVWVHMLLSLSDRSWRLLRVQSSHARRVLKAQRGY